MTDDRSLPPDNHVHSEWSWDTTGSRLMERTCARAVRLGLPAVTFTEHVDFTAWDAGDAAGEAPPELVGRARMAPLDVAGYFACIEGCRDRFPGLRILSGIEAGEPHWFAGSVGAVLGSGRFDRVLGSLHALRDGDRIAPASDLFGTVPAGEVMRRYFAELLDLVTGSGIFGVLAHCEYPRRRWPRRAGPYREQDFEDEYRTVFRELAGGGRALEVNTLSPPLSERVLRWWHEEGGQAVSFGSDAHRPERVGDGFRSAAAVAEAAGFRPGRSMIDFWRR